MSLIHQQQVTSFWVPFQFAQHCLIQIFLSESCVWQFYNRSTLRGPSVNSSSACHNVEVVGTWGKFEALYWVQVNEDASKLKGGHVPDPHCRRHLVTLRCHVVSCVTPTDFLNASWRPLHTNVFEF